MIRQFFRSAQEDFSFSISLNECLDLLESYYNDKNVFGGVIFFIDSNSDADYFESKSDIVKALDHKKLMMPYNIQAQSSKSLVSIEIWIVDFADHAALCPCSGFDS